MEAKLFEGDVPFVSTYEFHRDRERAPHWEQPTHRPRLEYAALLVSQAVRAVMEARPDKPVDIVDLGCGDGGLLQQIGRLHGTDVRAYGYDFQPSNVSGWVERDVHARSLNFVQRWNLVAYADIYVITECLEHLADPHAMVRQIHDRGAHIVASSPWTEHAESHDECHAWAWDQEGYQKMMTDAGFTLLTVGTAGMFQVVWGSP